MAEDKVKKVTKKAKKESGGEPTEVVPPKEVKKGKKAKVKVDAENDVDELMDVLEESKKKTTKNKKRKSPTGDEVVETENVVPVKAAKKTRKATKKAVESEEAEPEMLDEEVVSPVKKAKKSKAKKEKENPEAEATEDIPAKSKKVNKKTEEVAPTESVDDDIEQLLEENKKRCDSYWSRVLFFKCPSSFKGQLLQWGGIVKVKGTMDHGRIIEGQWTLPSNKEAQDILKKYRNKELDSEVVIDEYINQNVADVNMKKLRVLNIPGDGTIADVAEMAQNAHTITLAKSDDDTKVAHVHFPTEEDGKVVFMATSNAKIKGVKVVVIFDRKLAKKDKKEKKEKSANKVAGFGKKSGKVKIRKSKEVAEDVPPEVDQDVTESETE